ncbi:hypothetical protein CY35_01G183600 [Sphagnum magellanicum]|nr:hypothetical protein CY35_01G183600 [Sphagnum magellanicum]
MQTQCVKQQQEQEWITDVPTHPNPAEIFLPSSLFLPSLGDEGCLSDFPDHSDPSSTPPPPAPGNGHLFRRLQRLLFVKSCFQTAGCALSVRNPKLSCGICFFVLQKFRNSHCLLMEWGLISVTSLFAWQGNSFPRIVDCESE